MPLRPSRLPLVLLPLCLAATAPAHAAPSFDACVGFIDSLPATIGTQGNWCLRGDLATAMTGGSAITIAANNVTLDCNGFKIGGLAGGPYSDAIGIYSYQRQNTVVRQCTVRGFARGIDLSGQESSGQLVEDNVVDQSIYNGISVAGTGNIVRGNRVVNTVGRSGNFPVYGISARADIIDNTVENVYANEGNNAAVGIHVVGYGFEVRNNRVREMVPTGTGNAGGIWSTAAGTRVVGNHVSNSALQPGSGISTGSAQSFCSDNVTYNFATGIHNCLHQSGNLPAN